MHDMAYFVLSVVKSKSLSQLLQRDAVIICSTVFVSGLSSLDLHT